MDDGATTRNRATLATIAAAAGVSVATVSKVINGRSDVAPATRAMVQQVLQQHDYVGPGQRRVERAAQPIVELTFDGDLGVYSLEVLRGVMDGAAELGATATVTVRVGGARAVREARAEEWVRGLVATGRVAVIAVSSELSPAHLAALARARIPLVVLDPLHTPRARVTSVGSTNFAGGIAATEHLLGLGHRRIAYLGGPASAACNQARLHGYRAAMEGAGLAVPPDHVLTGHFVYADGVAGGDVLLDLPEPPTAVFAASDEMALGVLEAARVRGLRVPHDLSVVGFDDTQAARMASPPLTTVRQPLREMGRVAVRTALQLAAGEELDSHHVELATQLVVRASTAKV